MATVEGVESALSRAEEIIAKAEELVLVPELVSKRVKICGQEVELRPLTIKYSKIWAKKFRTVLGISAKEKERWAEDADDIICDALCEVLVSVKDFYNLGDISIEDIQKTMGIGEVRDIVAMQSELNGSDDFLQLPLRTILNILSGVSEVLANNALHVNLQNSADTTASSTQES